jgi:hypothetical protein
MGAHDLLRNLQGAGFSVTAAGGGIRIAPASALTERHRQDIRAHRAELLALVGDHQAGTAKTDRPTLSADLSVPIGRGAANRQGPETANDLPDPDRWCWPNSNAMTGAELAVMSVRIERYSRRGIEEAQAERLADLMKDCDRQTCDLQLCMDCTQLVGNRPWQCLSHRTSGVARDLPGEFVCTPQRCPVFKAAPR